MKIKYKTEEAERRIEAIKNYMCIHRLTQKQMGELIGTKANIINRWLHKHHTISNLWWEKIERIIQ